MGESANRERWPAFLWVGCVLTCWVVLYALWARHPYADLSEFPGQSSPDWVYVPWWLRAAMTLIPGLVLGALFAPVIMLLLLIAKWLGLIGRRG